MKEQSRSNKALAPYIWWKIDESELAKQISEYQTLDWKNSARKISSSLLVFSILVTVGFTYFGKTDPSAYVDAVIMAILSVFCFKGHSWALMSAMIYWSFSKVYLMATGFSFPILHIIWWAIYMKQFFLAWRVEKVRSKPFPQNPNSSKVESA